MDRDYGRACGNFTFILKPIVKCKDVERRPFCVRAVVARKQNAHFYRVKK